MVSNDYRTWRKKQWENLNEDIDNGAKKRLTVIPTIDAGGGKLPLMIPGKGKTPSPCKQ
jgi:hypothetical protein